MTKFIETKPKPKVLSMIILPIISISTSPIPELSIKQLSRSCVTLTNYPNACQVCQRELCQYDDNHCLGYIYACALENNAKLDSCLQMSVCLKNPLGDLLKKPPDANST